MPCIAGRTRIGWKKVGSSAEYHGYRRWQEIARYLNGSGDLSPERCEWMDATKT